MSPRALLQRAISTVPPDPAKILPTPRRRRTLHLTQSPTHQPAPMVVPKDAGMGCTTGDCGERW